MGTSRTMHAQRIAARLRPFALGVSLVLSVGAAGASSPVLAASPKIGIGSGAIQSRTITITGAECAAMEAISSDSAGACILRMTWSSSAATSPQQSRAELGNAVAPATATSTIDLAVQGVSYRVWGTYTYQYGYSSGKWRVWLINSSCSYWAVLVGIDITWCGAWNSGDWYNLGYMDVGFNFQVSLIANGVPVSVPHWMRESINDYGSPYNVRGG